MRSIFEPPARIANEPPRILHRLGQFWSPPRGTKQREQNETNAGNREAAKGFRRLEAYKHLPFSELRLQLINPSTSPNELNTTLTPHSIVRGDACFAYFGRPCCSQSVLCSTASINKAALDRLITMSTLGHHKPLR